MTLQLTPKYSNLSLKYSVRIRKYPWYNHYTYAVIYKLESDFRLKDIHFNKYFASMYTSIKNDGSLPSALEFYFQSRISSLNVTGDDVVKIVRALDISKPHDSLVRPLSLIYKDCIDTGIFPNLWKKSILFQFEKIEVNW